MLAVIWFGRNGKNEFNLSSRRDIATFAGRYVRIRAQIASRPNPRSSQRLIKLVRCSPLMAVQIQIRSRARAPSQERRTCSTRTRRDRAPSAGTGAGNLLNNERMISRQARSPLSGLSSHAAAAAEPSLSTLPLPPAEPYKVTWNADDHDDECKRTTARTN